MPYARFYKFNEIRDRLLECEGKASPITKKDAHAISYHGHREDLKSRSKNPRDSAFMHAQFDPRLHPDKKSFRNFDQLYVLVHVLNYDVVQICLENFDRRTGLHLAPANIYTKIDLNTQGIFPLRPDADRVIIDNISINQVMPTHVPQLSQRVSNFGGDEYRVPLNFVRLIIDRDPSNHMFPWIQTFFPIG